MRPWIRQAHIDDAVACLKNGGVVAIPTETVYGLAADASNESAVSKIFSIKGRPTDHPLIVHIANLHDLAKWARDIPEYVFVLAEHFWPGPMTLILKKHANVLKCLTGGQDTVGIRIPNHPVAQQILERFNGGLAAPSANRFGYISPTTADHVRDDLNDAVDLILDGGSCAIGIESTIIDCTAESPCILRPGMITQSMIDDALLDVVVGKSSQNEVIRVSGGLASHYAPKTTMQLLSAAQIDQRATVKNTVILSRRKPQQHHIKVYDSRIPYPHIMPNPDTTHWIVMPVEPCAYAHRLYEQLHVADKLCCDEIWIEQVPALPEWQGITDRITKASGLKSIKG